MAQSEITLGALVIMLLFPRFGFGGDCLSSLEEDVNYLEHTKYSDDTAHHIQIRLFCMRADLRTETNRWAGPIAAAYIKTCRESPLRDRIVAVCQGFLDERDDLMYEAARTMAHYAIGSANSEDIYSILILHRDDPPWLDLAVLGDPRTVTFIRELYTLRRPLGLEKRANTEALIAMLNCLYHIPGDDAVSLAREFLSVEADLTLRERLTLVVDRPSEEQGSAPILVPAPLHVQPPMVAGRNCVEFLLDRPQIVIVSVSDIGGHQVAVIEDRVFDAGDQVVCWEGKRTDGSEVDPGVYLLTMQGEDQRKDKRVVYPPMRGANPPVSER